MNIPFRNYFALLIEYLKDQRLRLLLLTVLLFSSIGLQLVNPLLLRNFIDAAVTQKGTETLTSTAGLFLGLAILIQIISIATAYVSENVAWRATNALRADLVQHCIDLDLSFHHTRTPGEMIERIDGDVTTLANFFSQLVVRVLGNIILLFGVLVVLAGVDWRVAVALAIFMFLTLFITNRTRNFGVPYWGKARQASANLYGFLEEQLGGTEDVRANGAKAYTLRSLYALLRQRLQTERKAILMFTAVLSTSRLLMTFGTSLAFALGAYLFTERSLSIGTVYLIYQYTEMLRQPLEAILFQIEDLQKASAGIVRISELLEARSSLADGPGAPLAKRALAVEFEDVSFGYAPDTLVLQSLSFHLAQGRVLGVLGRTGSGKTTLTRLLFRLYDPTMGRICLNQVDLRSMRLNDLNQRVGLVTQDVQLFHATVRDNLTFFNRGISDEQIMRVIDDLGLGTWFQLFPNRLDTEIGSGGRGLSAGEAQLLAFVRIFLKDPGLVMLDEASARLDPMTESLMEHAVDRLLKGHTAIIIAHRLSTIQRADEIMILEEGRIVEHGPREQLERDPTSRFARLLATGLEEVLA